jgi:hypothetical protein
MLPGFIPAVSCPLCSALKLKTFYAFEIFYMMENREVVLLTLGLDSLYLRR